MISYAQNLEDVMLERCFRLQERGFYIDAGAMHPLLDSVTFAFYERGWSGVNLEPNAEYCALLARFRPRDTNLGVGLADAPGEATLHILAGSGLSTLDPGSFERAAGLGYRQMTAPVRVTTLAAICERHASQTIDFLKIDVEGWEEKVIRGNDWRRFRPKVVLIEATLPNSPVPSWSDWDPLMQSAAYRFVYFDGMNRFYVAEEQAGLAAHFESPPNWFDGFQRFADLAARDALSNGPISVWRRSYRQRLDSLALTLGATADEAAYLQLWPAGKQNAAAESADVDICYRQILGREPDERGRANWVARLDSPGLTVRQLVRHFLDCEEFLAVRLKSSALP